MMTLINKLEASVVDDARVIIYNRHMLIEQATGKAGSYWQPSFLQTLVWNSVMEQHALKM